MLNEQEIERIGLDLIEAGQTARKAARPSEIHPQISIEDAYRISAFCAARKQTSGRKVIGHKVGLTSKAMQRASQIDEPDFGYLFDDMLFPDGMTFDHSKFCAPRVEIELTFVMSQRLEGPGLTVVDVLRATECVVPSMELIDARVEEPRKIFDTISDNAAAAGLILGGRPVRPFDIDLASVSGVLRRNNIIEETGTAAGVMGHPAMGVAWLANKLSAFGVALEPGHMVLAGSFVRPVAAEPGDVIHGDFGDLGAMSIAFSRQPADA